MRKCARFTLLVACSLPLLVPVTGFAQTPPVSELIQEVGTNLGFNQSDIDKLTQGEIVSRKLKEDSKKELAAAVAMVVKAPFGEVFERIQKGGVAGIAPYARGGDEAHPGKELSLAAEEMKAVEKQAPTFYAAFKNFPAGAAPLVENHFTWQIQSIQDRPTVVLVHRAIEKHQDYAVAGRREYFVGQSFNSLQIVAGAFSFGEDTLIFYTNRTFTDQVAGFGSGTKHEIGRKMMLGEIEKLFQSVRSSFETGSVEGLGARLARVD